MKYADKTSVSVARTRSEIEDLLVKYGATNFASGSKDSTAFVQFSLGGRHVRFLLPIPSLEETRFKKIERKGRFHHSVRLTEIQGKRRWEQECRSRWRSLSLSIKAKFIEQDSGIVTFERAFLAHILLPSGKTIAEEIEPRIAEIYAGGVEVKLLTAGEFE